MKIHNVRLGLAMNSSSTHSLIFLDELVNDSAVYDRGFGWDFFTAASPEAKHDYVGLTVFANLSRIYPQDVAFAVTKELFGYDLKRGDYGVEGYVDHQSEIALPRTWDEKNLDEQFVKEFRNYMVQDGLVILGGNDNTEAEHPMANMGKSASMGTPLEGNKGLVTRKDGVYDYWTMFNRDTGAKFRFSFDRNAPAPTKASAPELVDVKITDFCPFNCEFCTIPSTKISMADGTTKPISEIQVGDNISTKDGGQIVAQTQSRSFIGDLFEVELESGEILSLTPEHKVMTQRGWVEAKNLLESDEIMSLLQQSH